MIDNYLFSCHHRVIPDTELTYCISDIHGMYDQFSYLLDKIYKDIEENKSKTYKIIFHGDYVDRGLNSKLVLDKLMELEKNDKNCFFLAGNHDIMLLEYCKEYRYRGYKNHYWETLESFDQYNYDVPENYIKWLDKLPLALEDSTRIYVHAGINPHVELQTSSEVLWIREDFLKFRGKLSKIVVHGHTPEEKGPEILSNRVNLDTGCFYSGILSCVIFQENSHRVIQQEGLPIEKFRQNN